MEVANTSDEVISSGNGKIQNSTKVEAVKSEEDYLHMDDENIKLWTHSEDSKCIILVANSSAIAKSETPDLRDDEDYDAFSSGEETGDELQTQAENTSNSPPKTEKSAKKSWTREEVIKFDRLVSELCQGAPESLSVHSQCKFKCYVCGECTMSWNSIYEHFSRQHKTTILLSDLGKLISKVVSHDCQICSTKTLCDTRFISRHLAKHKILIGQYRRSFDVSKHNASVEYSNKAIGNLCIFQCHVCKMKFNTSAHFTKHLKASSHGRQRYIDGLTRTVYHKCKICEKSIVCDHLILLKHFKWNHNLTPKEYCEKYKITMLNCRDFPQSFVKSLEISKKANYSCVFVCNVCSGKFNRLKTFKMHIKKHNPRQPGPLMKYLVKGCSYQCKKCPSLMLCDRQVISYHVTKVHNISWKSQYEKMCEEFLKATPISTTLWDKTQVPASKIPIQEQSSRIGNLCSFTCLDCECKNLQSFPALYHHYKHHHSKKITYQSSYVKVARYHSCLICPNAVLSDRYFIKNHLYHHKIKFSEYQRIFSKRGGEILPTYEEWIKMKEG